MIDVAPLPLWPLLAAVLGLLATIGAGLLASDDSAWERVGLLSFIAILITLAGYAATGFALHFGGIGILIDHPDVAALVWEWTPLREGNLQWWGVTGWMGFGMTEAQTPLAAQLFLSALPLAATASLLAMMTLWRRMTPVAGVCFAALVSLLLAPLVGNWTQAGGWLMHLGESVGAGDGYLDFGGASFLLLAGGVALAALLAIHGARPADEGSGRNPMAGLGAGLLAVGSIGWIIASPLQTWGGSSPVEGALNGLLALAAGGLIGLIYGWFISGHPQSNWTARGAAAGWAAALASLPWMTPLQAMLVGAVGAWLFILTTWLIHDLLNWRDPGDIFAIFGPPTVWGLLAVGFFAPAPGQFKAQIIGVTSIALLSFFVASLFLGIMLFFKRIVASHPKIKTAPEPKPDAVSSSVD